MGRGYTHQKPAHNRVQQGVAAPVHHRVTAVFRWMSVEVTKFRIGSAAQEFLCCWMEGVIIMRNCVMSLQVDRALGAHDPSCYYYAVVRSG